MDKSKLNSFIFFNKMMKSKYFKDIDKRDTAFIKKFIKKEDVLLDVGCGWGRELLELSKYCNTVIGIDNDKNEITFAKDYLKDVKNKKIIYSDASNIKLDSSSINIALCLYNTLGNNYENINIILNEIKRLLKKDGIFICVLYKKVKNKIRFDAYNDSGLNPSFIKNDSIYFGDKFSSKGFTRDEIGSIFKKSKYSRISIKSLTDISYIVVAYK